MASEESEPGARAFRDAFGGFATGVAVVTAASPAGPVGLTTNAIASVSLEPPLFLVCFAEGSRTLPVVRDTGRLAVSILRASQAHMAERFASKHDPATKFEGIVLDDLAGAPAIAGAASSIVGDVQELVTAGDHEIAICRCVAVRHDPEASPLVFHGGRFGEMATS